MSNKIARRTISQYIESKNELLLGAQYNDERIHRFVTELECVPVFDDGTYDIADLDAAWSLTASENIYDDHGLNQV